MFRKILTASPLVLAVMLAGPALADGLDGRSNQSLEGFAGSASPQQMQQATRFRTAPAAAQVVERYPAGSNHPSQESYSPGPAATMSSGAATAAMPRFGSAPQTAARPDDFSWIGDVVGGG